ncbi:hypothetical protein A0H81_12906 [Grifola frondosa]|uniref:Uncharacterized protein n=1 Tax=Grifola frondosa TaxID=5627 RepID=A0A1C7LQS3_GRIFR|nr:hypothetical protein A0H81_12906 [Grifola frondosa]
MGENATCEIDANDIQRQALTAMECGGVGRSERKLSSYESMVRLEYLCECYAREDDVFGTNRADTRYPFEHPDSDKMGSNGSDDDSGVFDYTSRGGEIAHDSVNTVHLHIKRVRRNAWKSTTLNVQK